MTSRPPAVFARARRGAAIARLVGPHPIELARTFAFLVLRASRRRRLRALYERPLPAADVELRLPTIGLARFDELPPGLRSRASRLREEAEKVLAHRLDVLGSGLVELGPEINWHLDFKSGYRWPLRFHRDIEVTRLDDHSDAKVPWEVSRCHHLVTLSRAARLFEDERYSRELERQLSSWFEANPPGHGINWTNPMEVGIRAVNLVWAVATLEEWRPLNSPVRASLVESLRWHGQHIKANLEGTPYLRSNHYLGDILGLLVLGSILRGDPDARHWAEFAQRELEREIVKQVHADGASFEASLAYHGLVLEMMLLARYVASWAGTPLSSEFDDRLRRMAEVSRNVRHPNGRSPLFGDQDSGRVLPETFERPPTQDNLLWLAASLVGNRRPMDGDVHVEVAWTLGLEAWTETANLEPASPVMPSAFPLGGIYVLRSDRIHLVVRCGDVGQNGSGGHSHNDVLSYELSIDGEPLIVDSGTYAYTFDVQARNAFRSTRAHNTVVVDGEEINPIDPTRVFQLRRFARPNVERFELGEGRQVFVGSHDGYRRLTDPVMHRRRFALVVGTSELQIFDELAGEAPHSLQSFLHFASGVFVERAEKSSFDIRHGESRATVTFNGFAPEEIDVNEGWVSDRYGVRERASVLVATTRRALPTAFGYSITPAKPARRKNQLQASPGDARD